MKIQEISKYVLLSVIGVSAVIFAIFFGFWGNEMHGKYAAPTFTGLLICLMYALTAVTVGLIVWAVVKGIASAKGSDSSASTGVPGAKIMMSTVFLPIASLAFGFVLGIGEPDFIAKNGAVTSGTMVQVVDMFMWSMYILAAVAFVAIAVAMSGILTKTASKK